MSRQANLEILNSIKDGTISPEEALLKLKLSPYEDLGFAKIDHHRSVRQGSSEVIYGAGKTDEQILAIAEHMLSAGHERVLITRISPETARKIEEKFDFNYNAPGRIGLIGSMPEPSGVGHVAVAAAGTSDIPVAEEAAFTAEALGSRVCRLYDVGVAGIHRLLSQMEDIMSAGAIIAVAGMEGALPSVIGGLADVPVIAVPTSVGYGASFGGLAALLAMLNSCASGVSVVNIDNGFGAGYLADMINHTGCR